MMNQAFTYVTSANEVRKIMTAAGFQKKINPQTVKGTWINVDKAVVVGMCLASKTYQSSLGAGANWVYSIPK